MDDAILQRINRIYAGIGAIEESDPNKLRATVIQTEKFMVMDQDFRGGLSDEELLNQVHIVISNIANLRDHLRRWAAQNGHDEAKVDQTIGNCFELQIIRDLSNNEKHGYQLCGRSFSGTNPRLIGINRVMSLRTQAKKGSVIAMTIGCDGVPNFIGDGTAKAVVTGDVIDNDNNRIGDLYNIVNKAVGAWESLLAEFGLIAPTNDTRQS